MSKKIPNIHKRSDGRWEGRYKIGVYPDGRPRYASVYSRVYAEAKEKLIRAMAEHEAPPRFGKEKEKEKEKECMFSEVLEMWLSNNRLKQKGATEHKYRTLIERHIDPALGGRRMSQMSATVINTFLAQKQEAGRIDKKGGLSASYVRCMSHIIRSAMTFAVYEDFCQPLKSPVYKPALCKNDLQILSADAQKKLECYIFENSDDPTCVGILITLYAGLRIGEICALSWDDIDLSSKIIHVRHTVSRVRDTDPRLGNKTKLILDTPKTASSMRDIPISDSLFTRLFEFKRSSSHGFVLSITGDFVTPRTYENRFHRVLEKCGVASINYHALRHTFATRCIEAGVDPKSLSEMLGHANVGITLNTYVHSSMDMKRRQIEKLKMNF